MIYKSYIIEQNLDIIKDSKIVLFYGENQGLKKDLKTSVKVKYKNFEIIRLFQEEILKNKNNLVNEIDNKSLFNDKKIILIDEANDKILALLEEVVEKIDEEKIFIFSDVLEKKSKLRNYLEKSKNCGISACYQDNLIKIKKIISSKLADYQGLTPNILNYIIENTGLDRGKINNEIEKIKCCFKDKKIIPDKIHSLLNAGVNDDFNQLRDEALNGNKKKTNRLLADTVFEIENNIYYLNLINQRIIKLNEITKLKKKEINIETLINNLKPPIFWKDKPIIINQIKKWNKDKIEIALNKTYNAEVEMKSNSTIRKDLILKNLIIEICSAAGVSSAS